MADEVLFFGACGDLGHYLWTPAQRGGEHIVPESLQARRLDAKFTPKDPAQSEGRACLHHIDGWTVVAWWDRSVDMRMNSNSAILMCGTHTFPAVLLAAGEHFPELLPRFATLELTPS